MLSFVGNEKQDIPQQSTVSLITNSPSFKPTSIAGHVARMGLTIIHGKLSSDKVKGRKIIRRMRTWEVKY